MHAPGASACLAGWEIPASSAPGEADRRFEVLWSPEPEVVLDALATATELIAPLAPDVAGALESAQLQAVAPSSPELRAAVKQAHRMVAYIGAD
jgi:hypothetical protein